MLAFRPPKLYIAPYGKINNTLVKLSYNCDVKSGLSLIELSKPNGVIFFAEKMSEAFAASLVNTMLNFQMYCMHKHCLFLPKKYEKLLQHN